MVELNREIMTRIVDIALLIAKQGLAFRGKRNEAAYNLSNLTSNLNQGNFLEIVKLVAKYDPVLQTHINNSIKKSVIKQGKTGRGSYVLNGKINERMVALVESKSGTGEALYNVVKKELESLNIPLANLIGESFDGAAAMSGCYNGFQAHLKKIAPESIFTHCHAHYFFSDSYKRTGIWKNFLSKDQTGNDKLRKIQKLGTIRWNSKDAALKNIFGPWSESSETSDRYDVLLESLYFFSSDKSIDSFTSSDARFLIEKWTSFETIITPFIFLEIFHYTTAVSKYLQFKGLDFITVIHLIKSLLSDIKKGSSNYDKVEEKAINCISSKNNSDKIKKLENIFIEQTFTNKRRPKIKKMPEFAKNPHLINDDNLRYVAQKSNAESGIALKEEFLQFISFFNQTFNKIVHKSNTKSQSVNNSSAEFSDDFKTITCKSGKEVGCCSCPPHLLEYLYKYNLHTSAFSNLYLAYKYILTLSCTQVNCERAFSKLKILENILRSAMKEELLESLMLISIESDMIPEIPEIIAAIGRSTGIFIPSLCGVTEDFNVGVCVHQGSSLSLYLFSVIMDESYERYTGRDTMMYADDSFGRRKSGRS
ncbi:uncharacterized protein LOC112691815 [Sipha flava]|uniref:Uncharacterized protein LOC112691815 n=1 Tax=Sipha flava TaxID=143950 RepID=A0A8B8GFJ6_9HEMI|nr:uncharacterized protein LOC112691815 [Sipha flava]